MNEINSVHCSACGKILEYPQDKEGSTTVCPDCGNQVWFSQLAEAHSQHKSSHTTSSHPVPLKPLGENAPWTLGMLSILLLMNMYLGYMVISLKKEVIELKNAPNKTSEVVLTSTNMVVPGAARQALSKANTNQELVDILIEALEMMDNDLQLQLSMIQTDANSHAAKITELMTLSTQLNTSIESLYNDITDIGTNLEQLSLGLTQLQENQSLIQNSMISNQ